MIENTIASGINVRPTTAPASPSAVPFENPPCLNLLLFNFPLRATGRLYPMAESFDEWEGAIAAPGVGGEKK